MENNWIKVIDKLPNTDKEIYLKDKSGNYFVGFYKNGDFISNCSKYKDIVEWRNIDPWGMTY